MTISHIIKGIIAIQLNIFSFLTCFIIEFNMLKTTKL